MIAASWFTAAVSRPRLVNEGGTRHLDVIEQCGQARALAAIRIGSDENNRAAEALGVGTGTLDGLEPLGTERAITELEAWHRWALFTTPECCEGDAGELPFRAIGGFREPEQNARPVPR